MAEVGLLAPEARVELIDGEIFDMAPIGNLHGGYTAWLHRRLLRDLGEKISVWDQVTLPLGTFSAPEPDLVILKYRKDEYRNKRPSPDDVLLIVEVSQSSLHHDQRIKVPRSDALHTRVCDADSGLDLVPRLARPPLGSDGIV